MSGWLRGEDPYGLCSSACSRGLHCSEQGNLYLSRHAGSRRGREPDRALRLLERGLERVRNTEAAVG